jgi:hypothetical protein
MAKKNKVKTNLTSFSATPYLSQPMFIASKLTKPGSMLIARPDITFTDSSVSIDSMADFVFQDIGSIELLNILRNTSIKNPLVQTDNIIKDISTINKKLSPINILPNQNYSTGARLNLLNYVPSPILSVNAISGALTATVISPIEANSNATVTIKLINITDEFVEYQVADSITRNSF